jgi:two-component system, chemotaxis family, response regulator Rcp1
MSESGKRMYRGRPAVVLLVEDNDNDVELTKIGFEQAKFAVDLHVAPDGEECLAMLRREGVYVKAPTPDIILLDLHMPRMGGLEVLDAINADSNLRHIPVIVLTTSDSDREIKEAYLRRCSGYLVKPVGFEQFAKLVRALEDYWFTLVVLPSTKT